MVDGAKFNSGSYFKSQTVNEEWKKETYFFINELEVGSYSRHAYT